MPLDKDLEQYPKYRLSAHARLQQLNRLHAAMSGRSASRARPTARRLLIVCLTAMGLGLAGYSTATALNTLKTEPTNRDIAYCYVANSLDAVSTIFQWIGNKDAKEPDTPQVAVEICQLHWRSGAIQPGKLDNNYEPDGPAIFPVPELTACVLKNGRTAVFPGDETVCTSMGIAKAEIRPFAEPNR